MVVSLSGLRFDLTGTPNCHCDSYRLFIKHFTTSEVVHLVAI